MLSTLPLISAGNCLCCMWVLGGGSIATFMLARQQPARKLTFGDGAFAGVLSGLFGAVVATLMSIPLKLLSARFLGSEQSSIEDIFQKMPELQGPIREALMRVLSPEISAFTLMATFVSNLLVYSLFAMIGGILTVSALNKNAARRSV